MSTTLYRKYRPQTWGAVVDQNHVKITLQHEIERGHIAHAYLFSGGRGLGKTTIARLFAKSVNCMKRKKGSAEPCTACAACTAIRDGQAMDVLEIDAASHTGVDNVRENIIASSRVPPALLQYKVFIIDEAHMLSTAAFNALLKTLEEPPAQIIFILATTELHKVPETIVSRCQRFDFRAVPQLALIERLRFIASEEGIRVDDAVLESIATGARGSVRDAESLLGQVFALGEKHIKMESASLVLPHSDRAVTEACFQAVMTRNPALLMQCLENSAHEGADAVHLHGALIRLFRSALLARWGVGDVSHDVPSSPERRRALDNVDHGVLLRTLDALLACDERIRKNDDPFVVLEVALLSLFDDRAFTTPDTRPPVVVPPRVEAKKRAEPSSETPRVQTPPTRVDADAPQPLLSLEDIRARWSDVTLRVEEGHRALALVLQVGYPVAIEGECLVVGFAFDFHRDRMAEPKNDAAVRQAIEDTCGMRLRVLPRVVPGDMLERLRENEKKPVPAAPRGDPVLAQILTTFGGEVV
ncbi:DNA polymerase III subunit gamma/tau [Candidatus Uhrbacteria bacterium]|nr:DNA polymerase III subunit gamma/tau [Candidatus Uhrbacteria bacterium]